MYIKKGIHLTSKLNSPDTINGILHRKLNMTQLFCPDIWKSVKTASELVG